jgi:hypothetical protein
LNATAMPRLGSPVDKAIKALQHAGARIERGALAHAIELDADELDGMLRYGVRVGLLARDETGESVFYALGDGQHLPPAPPAPPPPAPPPPAAAKAWAPPRELPPTPRPVPPTPKPLPPPPPPAASGIDIDRVHASESTDATVRAMQAVVAGDVLGEMMTLIDLQLQQCESAAKRLRERHAFLAKLAAANLVTVL